MNILIVNDDGINSKGLEILARALMPHGKVYVSAPSYEQSGMSQAISIKQSLEIKEAKLIPGTLGTIEINGTPADAVRAGLSIFNVEFDLVVSGINNGVNIATDILYSGTVGAALEAKVYGIPSIAISADNLELSYLYDETIKTLDEIIENKYYLIDGILNVNFPKFVHEKPKGVMFTKQGRRYYHSEFSKKMQSDHTYYLRGSMTNFSEDKDSDVYAYDNGYISITPITTNFTKDEILKKLTNLNNI